MADRTRRFLWGLGTGYILTAANILYTLASIPLALHFLSKEQFGLWALVTQLASYMNLVDLGMQSSASRIFINYKDNKTDGNYGSLIKTSFYIFSVQGFAAIAVGAVLLPWLDQWINFPSGLDREFRILLGIHLVILAVNFCTRTFGCLLYAHQRFAWTNLGGAGGLLLGLGALAITLSKGWGLYSLIAASATSAFFNNIIQIIGCVNLRLLPSGGSWGRVQWSKAVVLFRFAKETFLMALGWQLISSSPTILISKFMGLEAAATWAIGTKIFTLTQQIVWKLFDFSVAGLSELFVRGEMRRLQDRFFEITTVTAIMSILFAGFLAFFNGAFVGLWTDKRILWAFSDDLLLALLLVSYSFTRCQGGFVAVSMRIGFAQYIYLLDGVLFCATSFFLIPHMGFSGCLLAALVWDLVLPGFYGLFRTCRFFGTSFFFILKAVLRCVTPFIFALAAFGFLFIFWKPLALDTWTNFGLGFCFYLFLLVLLFFFSGYPKRVFSQNFLCFLTKD